MIEILDLYKDFNTSTGQTAALQGVQLRLDAGERLGLLGHSGCGKTTLLRCLAGLESPDSGKIAIDGVEVFDSTSGLDVPPWKRPVGFVFQDFALWPHMRVLENVLFPLVHGRANSLTAAQAREAAMQALHWVRLDGLAQRFPFELSGGQRQRVALARAVAPRPRLLLMDEPLSSLDPYLREQTRNELSDILEEAGIATVFVSHDYRDCLYIAHCIGIMWNGRLVQKGPAEEVVAHPADASVAQALSCGVVIACRREEGEVSGSIRYLLANTGQHIEVSGRQVGRSISVEGHLLIPRNGCGLLNDSDRAQSVAALLGEVVNAGYVINIGWCVLVKVGDSRIEVRTDNRPQVQRGEIVKLAVDTDRIQFFERTNHGA